MPWSGASVPTDASGANPLAVPPPHAGAATTMTPGQSNRGSVVRPATSRTSRTSRTNRTQAKHPRHTRTHELDTPHTTDVFGELLPDDAGRACPTRSFRAGVRGDVHAAATVLDATTATAGDFLVRTIADAEFSSESGASSGQPTASAES